LALRKFNEAAASCTEALRLSDNRHTGAAMNLFSALRASGRLQDAISYTWDIMGLAPRQIDTRLCCPDLSDSRAFVACVKWGNKYTWEYVNVLFKSVFRHWTGPDFQFICFSDIVPPEHALDPRIHVRIVFHERPRFFWGKSCLFEREAFPRGAIVVYVDLDTVIVGDIFPIMKEFLSRCRSFALAALPALGLFNEKGLVENRALNTSILIFIASDHLQLIHSAANTTVRSYVHRFDHWMEMIACNASYTIDSSTFVDFRVWNDSGTSLSSTCCAIVFPGDVKPHMVSSSCEIIRSHWRA
jgi:hypothetical protein